MLTEDLVKTVQLKRKTCEKSPIPGVGSRHQVCWREHLTDQLGNGQLPVVHGAPGCQGSKPRHEEVKSEQYFWCKQSKENQI